MGTVGLRLHQYQPMKQKYAQNVSPLLGISFVTRQKWMEVLVEVWLKLCFIVQFMRIQKHIEIKQTCLEVVIVRNFMMQKIWHQIVLQGEREGITSMPLYKVLISLKFTLDITLTGWRDSNAILFIKYYNINNYDIKLWGCNNLVFQQTQLKCDLTS